jgi:hypothetical protein
MTDDDGSQSNDPSGTGRAHTADTVPPPAGGDVYNAPTEIRRAPDDLLDIMRQVKEARAAKAAETTASPEGETVTRIPAAAGVPSFASPVADPSEPVASDPPPAAVAIAPAVPPPIVYPGGTRRPRNRTTAVAVLTILVVVTVVLVAISLAITLRAGHPAT